MHAEDLSCSEAELSQRRAQRRQQVLAQPMVLHSGPRSPETAGMLRPPRIMKQLWSRRFLLYLLTRREIKVRYKNSALGVLWSLVLPAAQMAIYYFAIGKLLGAERGVDFFALYLFVGFTMWIFFLETLNLSTISILHNDGLVKKVYIPRELFPLATLGSGLFNFAVYLLVLIVALLASGHPPVTGLWLHGVLAIIMAVSLTLGLGMLVAALNVYFRDVQHLVSVVMLVLFWLTPVVYSYSLVHKNLHGNWLEQLYISNPLAIAIMGMQQAMWPGGKAGDWPPDMLQRLIFGCLGCLLFLWLAHWIFRRLQMGLAQEL